jgi:Rieske Fe-S protein
MHQEKHCCQDLPVDKRQVLGRRSVLIRMWACVPVFMSGLRLAWAQKKFALGLDKAEKLKATGGSALLKIQDRELLFIRDTDTTIRVVDPVCTHKRCTVEYNSQKQRIICPCHGSNFGVDGAVLNGPAEKPLQVFEASLDSANNRVIFTME